MAGTAFGNKLKELRIARRITLRQFCQSNGLDAGNYSKMERGLFPAPQKEELIERYALGFGLERGSADWIELFDLAAASRGTLPTDLLDNEELIEALPLFFRKLRAEPVSEETLDQLAEMIRRA